ncbi:hypothetical protein [Bradyrhizobium sp. USDA 4452]
MTREPLHGVALVRVSTSPVHVDSEFYGVFVNGELRPTRWGTWSDAFRHFIAEINGNDERPAMRDAKRAEFLDAMFGTNKPAKETA